MGEGDGNECAKEPEIAEIEFQREWPKKKKKKKKKATERTVQKVREIRDKT